MKPRTHAPYELRTLGGLRGWSAARETCLDGHYPLASVLQAASPCQNAIFRGARARRELKLADTVEHSFRCVLQLDSAKTEVPVGWQRCREEPICLRRNLAARKGARATLTARSKTQTTPL